jgi:hypothetical protein
MRSQRLRPSVGAVHYEGGTPMKKALTITISTVVLIALAATATLFTLSALAGGHQTCGKVNPAQLRAAADPNYGKKLEKLARCGY